MNMTTEQPFTYQQNRQCRYCRAPIPDGAHAATQFCVRVKLVDGSVKCCKDDYHVRQRTIEDGPYRQLAAFQRRMSAALHALKEAKGDTVTLEQLNQYGVQLARAVEIREEAGRFRFSFLHHHVEQQLNNDYKIKDHVFLF